jgi:hypothetical protein
VTSGCLQDRKPLSIEGRLINTGERTSGDSCGYTRLPGELIWACKEHRKADCKTCFDWPKLLRHAKVKKDRGLIEDPELIVGLLSSMGINLPANTKLSTERLERKLAAALNCAQDTSTYTDVIPVNPGGLEKWKVC